MKKSLIKFDVLIWALWSDGLIRYLTKSSEAGRGPENTPKQQAE